MLSALTPVLPPGRSTTVLAAAMAPVVSQSAEGSPGREDTGALKRKRDLNLSTPHTPATRPAAAKNANSFDSSEEWRSNLRWAFRLGSRPRHRSLLSAPAAFGAGARLLRRGVTTMSPSPPESPCRAGVMRASRVAPRASAPTGGGPAPARRPRRPACSPTAPSPRCCCPAWRRSPARRRSTTLTTPGC